MQLSCSNLFIVMQVGRSGSALFLNKEEGSKVKLSFSGLERGESQPLILRHGP